MAAMKAHVSGVLSCASRRAEAYRALEAAVREVLPQGGVVPGRNAEGALAAALAEASESFNRLGKEVNEHAEALEKAGYGEAAETVKQLQQCEREKLAVTIRQHTLRRERAVLEARGDEADVGERGPDAAGRDLDECTRELQRLIEAISEALSELRELLIDAEDAS